MQILELLVFLVELELLVLFSIIIMIELVIMEILYSVETLQIQGLQDILQNKQLLDFKEMV